MQPCQQSAQTARNHPAGSWCDCVHVGVHVWTFKSCMQAMKHIRLDCCHVPPVSGRLQGSSTSALAVAQRSSRVLVLTSSGRKFEAYMALNASNSSSCASRSMISIQDWEEALHICYGKFLHIQPSALTSAA